jgi:hypothetical protein
MATVLTRTYNGFSRNLSRTADEANIITTPPADLTDDLGWKLWVIRAQSDLARRVDADQLTSYMAEIAHLSDRARYHKLMAQIALEDARAWQEAECTCTPFDVMACPVCQKLADEQEIEF